MNALQTPQKVALLLIMGIAFFGMAMAGNHWGGQTTVHVQKTDGTNFPAKLAWYSDTTDASCTDTDNGVKGNDPGYMYFTETDTGNTNLIMDGCYDNDTVIEFACAKSVKLTENNGKKYSNYALTFLVDCKDIGKKKCVMDTTLGLPRGKCVN